MFDGFETRDLHTSGARIRFVHGCNKVQCPALVLRGAQSHTDRNYGDLLPIWREYCAGSLTGSAIDCGHYVPKHAPEETLDWFLRFFGE